MADFRVALKNLPWARGRANKSELPRPLDRNATALPLAFLPLLLAFLP